MKIKFVKLIRVPMLFTLSDGSERQGYRYMDIDGNIIAESIKGELYPSLVREIELEAKLDAKMQEILDAQKQKAEQDVQAEWEAMREKMKESLKK